MSKRRSDADRIVEAFETMSYERATLLAGIVSGIMRRRRAVETAPLNPTPKAKRGRPRKAKAPKPAAPEPVRTETVEL